MPPVIRELRAALTEARQPPGREPVATFSQVAGKLKKNDNVIRKFEKSEAGPRFDEIDELVAAYAESTGVSVFDLWDEALRRARKEATKGPRAVPESEPEEHSPQKTARIGRRRGQKSGGGQAASS